MMRMKKQIIKIKFNKQNENEKDKQGNKETKKRNYLCYECINNYPFSFIILI